MCFFSSFFIPLWIVQLLWEHNCLDAAGECVHFASSEGTVTSNFMMALDKIQGLTFKPGKKHGVPALHNIVWHKNAVRLLVPRFFKAVFLVQCKPFNGSGYMTRVSPQSTICKCLMVIYFCFM